MVTVVAVDGVPPEHEMAMVTCLRKLVNVTFAVAPGPRITVVAS
jgi:hypothetical protein